LLFDDLRALLNGLLWYYLNWLLQSRS